MMDEDLDKLEEALSYFMRAYWKPRTWHAIQRAAGINIDRPSVHLLSALCSNASGYKLHELAARIGIEAPSVTRTVQHLEQEKLIIRTVDRADRRAIRIIPTDQGVAIVEGIRKAKRERLKSMLSGWSTEDRKQLTELFHRLAREAGETSENSEELAPC